jgi:hypothetical protein
LALERKRERRANLPAVFLFHIDLTRRFHKAGVTILAGSDVADRDYDVDAGRALIQEMAELAKAGYRQPKFERPRPRTSLTGCENGPNDYSKKGPFGSIAGPCDPNGSWLSSLLKEQRLLG